MDVGRNSDGRRTEQRWTSDEMGTNVEQNDDETMKRNGLQLRWSALVATLQNDLCLRTL
jgi:hypothetical protein